MPDHLYRAQVTIRRVSAIPGDAVSNTWHFDKDEGSAGDWGSGAMNIASRLATFYQTIGSFLGGSIGPTAEVKISDMRDPRPVVPKLVSTFAITTSSEALPGEVACCLSFKATGVSGENMKRRRGRVYIGPLAPQAMSGTLLSGERRPHLNFLTGLVDAGLALVVAGAGDARLAIYSPTTDVTGSVDDAFHDVEDLWVDDAFDTVRSRGAKATVRHTRNVVG